MATEDGNVQDMSVHDKFHPSLAATEEAQDVASLNRIVVGMPAFTDPHNPMSQSGSVNLPLDTHPVTHSEDYGADVTPGEHIFGAEHSPMSAGAKSLLEDDDARGALDLDEDRETWQKADWQKAAKHYGLATSGNIDTIKSRVEDHEATEEAVEARAKELKGMSREELDGLAPDYDLDPADYSRREELESAILTAEQAQD